jgi:pyruvate kinase
MGMRRTKIVCTIGPASESPEMLEALIRAGMDVARLNFSHGTYDEHKQRIDRIREAARRVGKHVGIMLDIKGPKIRTGKIQGGQAELKDGATIVLTVDPLEYGTAERVSISYEGLVEDVYPGAPIRIDDGLIGLVVERVEGRDIVCRVTNGGILRDRKGINVPGVTLRIPGVTEKDAADIRFGIEQGVDFIAASFVRKAADVLEVRRLLEEQDYHADIIAKIETQEGLDRLAEIVEVADGIMVARGDLGVEVPTEEVPLAQKRMIALCNAAGKPVITATQMLDSMQRNPRPTRAEASDVANAIFDGTDAIMLSGETAAGRYPLEAVRTMAQIAERAERALAEHEVAGRHKTGVERAITDVIGHAAQTMASDLGVKAILTATTSGYSARMMAKHRPAAPIVAATPRPEVARRLTVTWGVYPVVVREASTTDEVLETAVDGALDAGLVQHGDLVLIIAGVRSARHDEPHQGPHHRRGVGTRHRDRPKGGQRPGCRLAKRGGHPGPDEGRQHPRHDQHRRGSGAGDGAGGRHHHRGGRADLSRGHRRPEPGQAGHRVGARGLVEGGRWGAHHGRSAARAGVQRPGAGVVRRPAARGEPLAC